MSDTSVVSKIKELRKDLDKETNFLQQQMELPLNGNKERNYSIRKQFHAAQ